MISIKKIDAQLAKVGVKNRFFARPEIKELCHILTPNEVIMHAVNGRYEGGFALFIATDRRILLIDKKPWFLTMEDIRYDMVSEVDYFARLLDASVVLNLLNKKLKFKTWSKTRMRNMVGYIQHRVMDLQNNNNRLNIEEEFPQALSGALQNNYQTEVGQDFAASYHQKIKQHSLAHVAGQMAVGTAKTKQPIIRPLYPRPSLMARYGRSSIATESVRE